MKTAEFYEELYKKNKNYEGGSDSADYKFKEVKKEVDKNIEKHSIVLDIGCSSGRILKNYVDAK